MDLTELKPVVKVTIENPASRSSAAFGPGIAQLCHGIKEHGSLNAAAKEINMAYSKAWRIVRDTEHALGVQLLIRDGARGSSLTDQGEKLLKVFDDLTADVQADSEKTYVSLAR